MDAFFVAFHVSQKSNPLRPSSSSHMKERAEERGHFSPNQPFLASCEEALCIFDLWIYLFLNPVYCPSRHSLTLDFTFWYTTPRLVNTCPPTCEGHWRGAGHAFPISTSRDVGRAWGYAVEPIYCVVSSDTSGKQQACLWASLVSLGRRKDTKDEKTRRLWEVRYISPRDDWCLWGDGQQLSKL